MANITDWASLSSVDAIYFLLPFQQFTIIWAFYMRWELITITHYKSYYIRALMIKIFCFTWVLHILRKIAKPETKQRPLCQSQALSKNLGAKKLKSSTLKNKIDPISLFCWKNIISFTSKNNSRGPSQLISKSLLPFDERAASDWKWADLVFSQVPAQLESSF